MGRTARLTLLLLAAPGWLVAQGTDSLPRGIPLPVTDSARRLPADQASGLISWIPGGSIDIDGQDAWHGRSSQLLDRTIDGIGWGSLIRSSGGILLGATLRRHEPAFNAISRATLYNGAYDASLSAGGPGLLGFTTLGGGAKWSLSGTAESESPVEADGGPGVSRFEVSAGGPLVGGWRVRAAATLTGRESQPTGTGYADSPYYVPTGTDTTLSYSMATGDPLTDTVTVSAQTYGTTSSVPYSPRTTTDLFGRVDGKIGKVSLWGRYLFGGDAERLFAYQHVSNSPQTFVRDGRTQDFGLGAATAFGAWGVKASVTWQEERAQEGPIDPTTDAETRDPTLGILSNGVGLRYDMQNFPVDDELQWNYRLNTVGSRRSPYDLENTAQYALKDQFRNNAYGVLGFSESGGPVGTLKLYRDQRVGLTGSVAHPLGGGEVEVGGELRDHDIQYYSHSLTSQAYSDVWLVKPTEQALFANWTIAHPTWRVALGLRMDRFNTGARRPRMIPRLSSQGTYVDPVSGDTLRWSRSDLPDSTEWYAKNTDADEAHVAVSPRLFAEGVLGAGWTGHVSLGRLARTPDLAVQLAGLNTDLAITNQASVWGTDYGHEITDLIEAGVKYGADRRWVDLTVFQENHLKAPYTRTVGLFDPARLITTDIRQTTLLKGPTYTGLTLAGLVTPTEWLTLSGAVTHIANSFDDDLFQASDPTETVGPVRPNTLVLTAEAAPVNGMLRGFGAIVSWRQASGMAYAIPTLPFWVSGQGDVRIDNIPTWKSLDLRLTKTFDVGGSPISVYLDGRNVLNVENLLRAFDVGDPKRNSEFEAEQWSVDSNDYAREALASGKYNAGDIDLTFGGAVDPRTGCGGWVTAAGQPNPINCVYLIGAEERFGDGDHTFTLAEQHAASLAYYQTSLGASAFTGPPRSLRIGAQIGF